MTILLKKSSLNQTKP